MRRIWRGVRRLRLVVWAAWVRLLARRRGVDLQVDVGRGVRFATVPRLRVLDRGHGGSARVVVGDDVDLGRELHIDVVSGGAVELLLGAGTEVEHGVRLQVLGGSMQIGSWSELSDGVSLKTTDPDARLVIGDQAKIMRRASVQCHSTVTIGELAGIADKVTIIDSQHIVDGSDEWCMGQPLRARPIEIGRNCLLLTNAVILDGVTMGANSVVGANALVTRGTYPPSSLLLGSPAKVARELTAERPTAPPG